MCSILSVDCARISGVTSTVAEGSVSRMRDTELIAVLKQCEQQRHQLYAQQLTVLAELDGRNAAPTLGYSCTGAIARDVLRLDPSEAKRRMDHTHTLLASLSPTGALLEPELPEIGTALAAGEISPEHAQVIRGIVAKLPRPVNLPDREAVQQILLAAAREHEPRIVALLGREIIARLDQDGDPPPDERDQPRRSLDLHSDRATGRVWGRFDLDPETGTLLTNLLSPHTAPQSAAEGEPDRRSQDERHGDAFADILRLAATNTDGPTEAGEPVNLFITIPLEKLEEEVSYGLLDGVAPVSAAAIRRMACDANLIPAVLGSKAEILDIGRKHRTIPTALRRALIARDGGCAFPGCDRKPKWCHAHHVDHWINGGPTALNNLALLCARHHKVIHHGGWDVHIRHGRPEFLPPPWLDPTRTPRRNPLHRPLE